MTGPCEVAAGQQIGSSTAPVLLMVTGNQLHLAIYSQLNGLVLMPGGDPSNTVDINISPEAVITGALMVEGALEPASRLTVRYDRAVLRNLQKLRELQRVQAVIGSWRDF
ncbi:hypothetical protein IT774_04845 [Salinimonas marina]|uniref:Uncharacterized protein n=1 Tax=Salinimonas marina TaxID=2785918 RepID=A0A7S9HE14_9ALTE|nr:hypothetical protein [Salinimonas marina]QPG06502.1 hypothetical protein IT774_04845 [Salinimonas marina]